MKFDQSVIEYLDGRRFTNSLQVRIGPDETYLIDRIALLENIVRGKKVIHLGCADHLPLIEEKRKLGQWLHERLDRSAALCMGIDINSEAVDYLRNNLGYRDVVCADILGETPPAVQNNHWDLLVMGELIEHIDDPVTFLRAIHNRFSPWVDHVAITVPNALSLRNFLQAFHNVEVINTDHRFWFTPFTLAKIVTQAGMQVETFNFVEYATPMVQGFHPKSSLFKLLLRRYPAFRVGLVMQASLNSNA